MSTDAPIVIAGGGIGGLSAAIALAGVGARVRVCERAAELSEVGAGLQLGPNATRILVRLGVADRLRARAVVPRGIRVFDGVSGRQLTALPLNGHAEARYGAPYWLAHRADLQAALCERVSELAGVQVETSCEVTGYRERQHGIVAQTGGGDRLLPGRGLVFADGVWSRGRQQVASAPSPAFLGKCASRALVDADRLPALFGEPYVGIWLAPDCHLVHYPVQGGDAVNLVLITEDSRSEPGWFGRQDAATADAALAALAAPVRELCGVVADWGRWPLYELPALPGWSDGAVTLLGDAAHPVLPFLAQGAALAIEDAAALGDAFERAGGDVAGAWQSYERARRSRATRLQAASRRNGRIYHLPGVARSARNAILRFTPPSQVLARYDWVYGYGRGGPAREP